MYWPGPGALQGAGRVPGQVHRRERVERKGVSLGGSAVTGSLLR